MSFLWNGAHEYATRQVDRIAEITGIGEAYDGTVGLTVVAVTAGFDVYNAATPNGMISKMVNGPVMQDR